MPEPSINFDEWRKELDALRPSSVWTEEMDRAILLARDHANPVSYHHLERFFESKGWNFKKTAIQMRYHTLKKR